MRADTEVVMRFTDLTFNDIARAARTGSVA